MSVIGTLSVKITGDTADLDKKLKATRENVAKFGEAAATAAAAVGAAFGYMAKKSIDNMDSLYKMSQMVGTTTETLSALGYAAQLSGVNQDALTSSLARLSRGLAEAQQGTGEALKAFQALQINPAQFKSADQALMSLADRFAMMEDGANKTALAMALFGRSGAQLIPFLNAGRNGIQDLKEEARKLGVVIDSETAKAAEEFNDNMERLKVGVQGLVNVIVRDALPELNKFVLSLKNIGETNFWTWFNTSTPEETNAAETIAELTDKIEKLEKTKQALQQTKFLSWWNSDDVMIVDKQIDSMRQKIEYLSKALLTMPQVSINWDTDQMESAITPPKIKPPAMKADGGAKKLSEYEQSINALKEELALLGKQTEVEKTLELIQLERFGKLSEAQKQSLIEAARAIDVRREEIDMIELRNQVLEDATGRKEADRFLTQMGILSGLLAEGKLNALEFEAGIQKLTSSFAETSTEIGEFAKEAARNIQDALGDALENALNGNFKNIGDSFAKMLNRMMTQLAASQLNKLLFGSFDKTGDIGGIIGTLGEAIGSLFKPTGGLGGASVSGIGTTAGGAGAMAFPVSLSSGLSSGGYTGDGGKYDPAGIVHRGEYVLNAAATKRLGVANLDRMNKGYASGGYVGSGGTSGNVNINIKNEAGGDGYTATAQARRNETGLDIDVIVRKVVSSDLRNNGGLSQQMAATFGLRRNG